MFDLITLGVLPTSPTIIVRARVYLINQRARAVQLFSFFFYLVQLLGVGGGPRPRGAFMVTWRLCVSVTRRGGEEGGREGGREGKLHARAALGDATNPSRPPNTLEQYV